MRRGTKQTLMTGVSLFLAGVICLIIQSNDGKLVAYVLFAFGVWEIGDAISDYFFNDEEETIKERPRKEIVKKFKLDVIRITVPMLLSMVVEVAMGGTDFKVHTLIAYLFILFIYLFFISLFTFSDIKQAAMLSKFIESKKISLTLGRFVDFERKYGD